MCRCAGRRHGEKRVQGVVPVRKLESTPDFMPRLIRICGEVGVETELVLPHREFFNARVIGCPSENKMRFPIPCRSTDAAAGKSAAAAYARRGRPRVPRLEIV